MGKRYGMSDKLGPMIFGQKDELVFLGREIGEQRDYSEHIAEEVDEEVRRIVNEDYERVKTLLTENRERLDRLAQRLLDIETVSQEEFLKIMGADVPQANGSPASPAKPAARPAESGSGSEYPSALDPAPPPARGSSPL